MATVSVCRILGLYLSLLLTLLTKYALASKLEWTETNLEPRQGDELEITCTATAIKSKSFFFIKFSKVLFVNGRETAYSIGTFKVLEDGWADYAGYRLVSGDTSDTSMYTTLIISNAKGSDGGRFKCSSSEAASIYLDLQVKTPLTRVYFNRVDNHRMEHRIEAGDAITMKQDDWGGMSCIVENANGNYEPSVVVKVNNNETDKFEKTTFENTTEIDGAPTGIVQFIFNVRMMYYTMAPDYTWNGKSVECIGESPGFDSVTGSVKLNVEHSPQIVCDAVDHYSKKGGEVTMQCSVFANPAANVTVFWGASVTDNMLNAPGTRDNFRYDLQRGDDGEQVVVLSVSSATEADFTYKYQVSAENKYGKHYQQMLLKEGDDGVSASGHLSLSFLILFTEILFLLLKTYV